MDVQSWDWLAAALAEEIASGPPGDADWILARLRARLSYASADPDFDAPAQAELARIALVERIAQRLEAMRPPSLSQAALRLVAAEGEAA